MVRVGYLDAIRRPVNYVAYAAVAVSSLLILLVGLLGDDWSSAWVLGMPVLLVLMQVLRLRSLGRQFAILYPDGFTASAEYAGGIMRLVNARSTSELPLANLRGPRVFDDVVTTECLTSRRGRMVFPRALVPDEAIAQMQPR